MQRGVPVGILTDAVVFVAGVDEEFLEGDHAVYFVVLQWPNWRGEMTYSYLKETELRGKMQ